MSEDNITKPDINISEKAQFFIEQAKITHGKTKEHILNAYNQLREDGFTYEQAKEILLNETGFGQATIYRALPENEKDHHMQQLGRSNKKQTPVPLSYDNDSLQSKPIKEKSMIEVIESRPVIESEPEPLLEPVKPLPKQQQATKQILYSKMFPTEQWKVFSKKEDCVFIATIENNQIKKIEVLGRKIAEKLVS